MSCGGAGAHENPFRTSRLGRLAFRFPAGWDMDRLLGRLEALDGRGAIVGPRGSGKTTLLHALGCELRQRGFRVAEVQAAEDRRWPSAGQLGAMSGARAVLLDATERLAATSWRRLIRYLRRVPVVVITAHRPRRLPTLFATATTPALLEELVAELDPGRLPGLRPSLPAIHRRHRGDLHGALLELYDVAAAPQIVPDRSAQPIP